VIKLDELQSSVGGLSIVLTGGGTAGHVLPNIALLPHLRKSFDRIYYIGSDGGVEKGIAEQAGLEYFSISTAKLRRSLSLSNLLTPFKVLGGISGAKKLLRRLRPSVVFSMGGFVAYPVVAAASKLGIPVVIHESDYSMGLANKMSAKHADAVCTTFEATAKVLSGKYPNKKVGHTGTPLRSEIFKGDASRIEALFAPRRGGGALLARSNLLVVGGSQGARRINEAVVGALPELLRGWNILHVVGKGKLVDVNSLLDGYKQVEYMENIADAYAWADVVVSRAGSGAMSELLVLNKRVVFIPMSTGRGDQLENAAEVKRLGKAEVLLEEELCGSSLLSVIERAQGRMQHADARWGDGSGAVVDTILSVVVSGKSGR